MCTSAAATLSLPGPGHRNQATAARHVSLCQHPGSRSHSVLQTRPHHEAARRAFSPRPRGDPRPQKSVFVGRQSRPCHHLTVGALCVTSSFNDLQQQQKELEQVWGLSRATNLLSLRPKLHNVSLLPVATAFLKGSSLGQLFFFLPSKLMGNTLSQRESQHFEQLQHCTQTSQESSPTRLGWVAERQRQGVEENFRCYVLSN